MFCSISPQCCKAATQSMLGVVGRPTTMSLMAANSWSPFIITIRKPRRRYILYIASKATQMTSLDLLVRWVIVVKHILVQKVVKNTCLLTNKQSICQFHILLEFNELLEDFDNTLHQALAVPSNCIPFQLEDRLTPNHFRGLDIINSHI
jgi:hypothetical protein